jgi:hypothetical protein
VGNDLPTEGESMKRIAVKSLAAILVLSIPIIAQVQESVDLDAFYRIKNEGYERSQVMDVVSYLTDVHGPRLTGSPNITAAADYAREKLISWNLSNVKLEPWGPFGRGWSNELVTARVIGAAGFPLIVYPKAWTPGTAGAVTGDVVVAAIQRDEDFAKFRGQLRGKFVMTAAPREVAAQFQAPGRRYTDEDLTRLSQQPEPRTGNRGGNQPAGNAQQFNRRRMQFFLDEGVAALIETSAGTGGTMFVQSGGSRNPNDPPVAPQVVMAVEHYNRILRMIDRKVPVRIELNIQNRFHDENPNAFNIIAEIPGTDLADEVVMLGAHFDSWHTGTGATDNAAGSAIMMEAMRILKTTGVPLRRTVRMALWTGEEQGLLGSAAYVREHFADRNSMQLKPAHAKMSAYFNVDNGTGAIRGVYLQGNEAVSPVFSKWMEPLRNLGMTTLSIRGTGGTDHINFDDVGLPGFQFIQDPIEYDSRTHHSNMDVYDRVQAADMIKNSVIVATFVHSAANRDARLPRKPLPAPRRQNP